VAGKTDLLDAYRVIHPRSTPEEGTFNGWRGQTTGSRIDWIFASPTLKAKEASIETWSEGGRYPSDHFPVTAVLEASP
jgi:endonuclease/exonuclease/phosphatase family metal-dependent hydrolase